MFAGEHQDSAEEALVCVVEIKKPGGHVNQNRDGPEHGEKQRAPAELVDVDHEIKQAQKQQAPPGAVQHERTGPQVFVDRKGDVPQPCMA